MHAMVLRARGAPLIPEDRPDPVPGAGEVRIRIEACAVCRTDLHVIDGELPHVHYPIVPGHEIVGMVEALGAGSAGLRLGQRVGIPWLGKTCGRCEFCRSNRENLCDEPTFTGYDRDGGFATHTVADAAFAIPMDAFSDPIAAAPLLCAGLIGWRSLAAAGEAKKIGLYGFGAAAHVIAQVGRWQGREVFAFTRAGDEAGRPLPVLWGRLGGRLRGRADRTLGCCHYFCAGGRIGSCGAQSGEERRKSRLQRHSHERHSIIPIQHPTGGA